MRKSSSILVAAFWCVLINGCAPIKIPRVDLPASESSKSDAAESLTAGEILAATSRCYAEMRAVRVDVLETISLDRSGTRDIGAMRMAALLARPNQISLPAAESGGVSFHADGQQLWTVLGDRFRESCPDTLALIADDPVRNSLLGLSSLFLIRLLDDDPQAAITREVQSMIALEDALLDGQRTHRLQFTQPQFDWELWVAVDEPRLIQQIVIDMSKQLGVSMSDDEDARITTTIRFQNWRIDPRLDAGVFGYQPAAGAQQVEHVMGIGR